MTVRVVLNATPYDGRPSGARTRAIGLTAAFLAIGADVTVLLPRGLAFAPLVEDELGDALPAGRFREVATGLDPRFRIARALLSERRLARFVPRGTDLFVTDSYPVIDHVATALTIHDFRDFHGPTAGASAARSALVRAALPALVRKAHRIVVPSRSMVAEARAFLDVDVGQVVVAPNAALRVWRDRPAPAGPGRHFVVVGAGDGRKDLATVVAAAESGGSDVLPVFVTGRRTRALGSALARAKALVRSGRVRFVETPGDSALLGLVEEAEAVLHPSRYEGFGLPVIEAFSVGVPVIAARCAAVEEVAGGLAHLLPPGDVGAWAAALRAASVGGASRSSGAELRRRRAAEFSWRRSAVTLLGSIGRSPPDDPGTPGPRVPD